MSGRRIAVVGSGVGRPDRPLLTRLFSELGVATQDSEMSMSVRCRGCGLQYAGQRGPGGLLAGLRRGRGRYARMLAEVTRFHRAARRLLDDPGDQQTLGQFLGGGYSAYFTAHFAGPFVAAVWSCPARAALDYPARYLFTFLANQLERFKADPANHGKIMDHGLWRYTRHPTYFGDACVWWGIFLIGCGSWVGLATLVSPLLMTYLLVWGSGKRLTEKRMVASRPGYAEYAAKTSGFIPLPPRSR